MPGGPHAWGSHREVKPEKVDRRGVLLRIADSRLACTAVKVQDEYPPAKSCSVFLFSGFSSDDRVRVDCTISAAQMFHDFWRLSSEIINQWLQR